VAELVSLSDWITSIRAELTDAVERQIERESAAATANRPLLVQAMKVKEIRLELDVATETSKSSSVKAGAGLKFWVVASAKVEGEHSAQRRDGLTQRVVITIEPTDLTLGDGTEPDLT